MNLNVEYIILNNKKTDMKTNEFIKEYNFHDKRAYGFELDKQNNVLKFFVSQKNDGQITLWQVIFDGVSKFKCTIDISKIDEYLLNIFKSKHTKNGIEIVFDNENYTTIYFSAQNIEVIE